MLGVIITIIKKKIKKLWYLKAWTTETSQKYFADVTEINSDSFVKAVNRRCYLDSTRLSPGWGRNLLYVISLFWGGWWWLFFFYGMGN